MPPPPDEVASFPFPSADEEGASADSSATDADADFLFFPFPPFPGAELLPFTAFVLAAGALPDFLAPFFMAADVALLTAADMFFLSEQLLSFHDAEAFKRG